MLLHDDCTSSLYCDRCLIALGSSRLLGARIYSPMCCILCLSFEMQSRNLTPRTGGKIGLNNNAIIQAWDLSRTKGKSSSRYK